MARSSSGRCMRTGPKEAESSLRTRIKANGPTASRRLLKKGEIAATSMVNRGSAESNKNVRIGFPNEPVERLRGTRRRFRDSVGE
jgi:hypothetical protein